ncbi:MAG TPA: hypothetical protein VG935_01080, partial [Patescibacteria group bacterium]|nr:hypothetical protein [Patescibacteria group bacterium]
MHEFTYPDKHEKIPPGQTLLFAEPIFAVPDQWQGGYQIPLGSEEWIAKVVKDPRPINDVLLDEYAAIALSLKRIGADFRMIVAHKKDIDQNAIALLMTMLQIR